ncbi:MAG: L-serine ammonia-lyase, iron-sulfur-dependent, subunit alpha [Erysipelotrichaceae bacterium]
MANYASIFNDVLGPIMRGPSSSHGAGAFRIGQIIRQLLNNNVQEVICKFDPNGSLCDNHALQGTDMGFAAGILGMQLTDEGVEKAMDIALNQGVSIIYENTSYGGDHPNQYRCHIKNDGDSHIVDAISVGGGMILIRQYDGFNVNIVGDYYELLIKLADDNVQYIKEIINDYDAFEVIKNGDKLLINIKSNQPISFDRIQELSNVIEVKYLLPILPTLSSTKTSLPFTCGEEMIDYSKLHPNMDMADLAILYETKRGNCSEYEVYKKAEELLDIMINGVNIGLSGTNYDDRILHFQCGLIDSSLKDNKLVPSEVINNSIKCITALMECKSSMNVIVAAPTAGSCGCLAGTIVSLGMTYGFSKKQLVRALLASGLEGVFFANLATFSAEIAGCQVECGAGSGMAASAISYLFNGTPIQCVNASSLALQNVTGLCCDPVADRVEVPCLGKNIMASVNALSSVNMILAGYDYVIPLDETIKAMLDIGLKMPQEIKCTLGGLGKTKTSQELLKKLS